MPKNSIFNVTVRHPPRRIFIENGALGDHPHRRRKCRMRVRPARFPRIRQQGQKAAAFPPTANPHQPAAALPLPPNQRRRHHSSGRFIGTFTSNACKSIA